MKYTKIDYEEKEPVTIITFNRPEVKNCIGPVTHTELVNAFDRFRVNDEAKVAVITGPVIPLEFM